jgi:hypothetical protein
MKKRMGFVANSSSSSFILAIPYVHDGIVQERDLLQALAPVPHEGHIESWKDRIALAFYLQRRSRKLDAEEIADFLLMARRERDYIEKELDGKIGNDVDRYAYLIKKFDYWKFAVTYIESFDRPDSIWYCLSIEEDASSEMLEDLEEMLAQGRTAYPMKAPGILFYKWG